jgi:histidyl-tRNA synthetase
MAAFQSLPGFRDFYPEAYARRKHLFARWREAARTHGFAEYDAPILEPLELYTQKSGAEIEKQLFRFEDMGGRMVALRPEMTPTVCRMVGARANALKRPIKWFSIGEFFRYERPQKGRGRCFAQLNCDIFGESGVEAEIELIALLVACLRGLGLDAEDFYVRLSDRDLWCYFLAALGFDDAQTRDVLGVIDKYEKTGEAAFAAYTEAHGEMDAARKARVLAFLQVKSLADLEAATAELGGEALQSRLADWRQLLAGLEAMGLGDYVTVDLGVVRGLAYYTGFVFEAFDRKGDLRALAGGGRYNDLVAKLGGPDLPAVGFAIGDMTMELLLEQRGRWPELVERPDVYVVAGTGEERRAALRLIQELRADGRRVEYALRELAFGKQFKAATESGATWAATLGGDELARGVVKLRHLGDRREEEIPRDHFIAELGRRLAR